ncbi:BQ2448_6578 [Microbotryum intermedium]|uniref:BQ2448_6578 protein n=1 Tax=Microbotryum intermedium TaxID=269621 RepID=A0A238FSQ9_9BASI|nr:BQ2448_6578 [Microbotryum intermedium]
MASRRTVGHRASVNAAPSLSPETSYRREPSPSLSSSSYLSIEDSLASTSSQAHHLHLHHNLTASSSASSSRPNRRGNASTTHPYALQQDAPDADIDPTHDESFNRSSTSSSTSTTTHLEGNDTDSLIDASDEQVEQRALEFLDMPLPGELDQDADDLSFNLLSNPTLPISLSSTNSNPSGTAQTRPLRVQDLPRQPNLNVQSTQDQHQQALSFLQNQLAKLSDTDWIDDTPAPFQHHAIADPRKVAAAPGLGSGGSQGGAWLDQRFNLERYASAFEDEPVGLEHWQPSTGAGEGRFADSDGAHAML